MPTATTGMCHVSAIAMPYPNTDPPPISPIYRWVTPYGYGQTVPYGNGLPPKATARRPPTATDRRPPTATDRRPPTATDRRPPTATARRRLLHRTQRDLVWRVAEAMIRNTVMIRGRTCMGHYRYEYYRISARGRSYGFGRLRLWPGGRENHYRRPSKRARPWITWTFFYFKSK